MNLPTKITVMRLVLTIILIIFLCFPFYEVGVQFPTYNILGGIMKELIILIMNEFGYIGIMILIFIENIFPPIPSEVILTFGGFMTTYSNINVVGLTGI